MKRMPALSIRQPHAEQILRGKKKIEYRNMPTNKRERVYIYASKTPADQDAWDDIGLEPGDLPTGVIVGTVEVVGCRKVRGEYEWDLARPVRLKRPLKPKNHPQPAWFYPF
jgi:predicted transcriptional regulator